ncbi:transcriptional regulator MraZ [Hahella sp. KA22]|nr:MULTISPECIES: division/cell wall cluster transcriptional repressor MraZ [Hahella]MBU6951801.1 division/cell wall cluster transcriptional repressor MraZ [Hahella sp. HN01]AZZ90487.1 transcriptional regulator MraZ [Hahella sp. KA22]MDG9670687.1 division/cell wall cluster transcriptional repressor MraZ [Hahella sp. CR1]QAY53857.1 transcriptional regulator MraZ [Hahella sp. KA22]WLQ14094.1 division/cell wall cluster transcriptional repressor MraZ [Hahella sp. HNIBRBA332]
MFRGVNAINMDSKGRFAMPTRYRDRIAEISNNQMIATIDTQERCLLIYPLPEWEQIESQIAALPAYNPATRRIQRLLLGHATELEIDGAGRVLLSQPLREYAYLDKKLILLGQGKKFELWDEDHWTKRRDEYLDEDALGQDVPEELMNIAL